MHPPSEPTRSPRQLRLRLSRKGSHNRSEFVASPTNAEALAALDAWPAWHGGCLALVGPAGCGKSHLARDWAARVGAVVVDRQTEASPHAPDRPVLV